MFTLLNKDAEIGIRFPKDVAEKFKMDYKTNDYYSYGAKMKDYVLVPESLYKNKALLVDFFETSFKYVNKLPTK
jgi:hypothetical protein